MVEFVFITFGLWTSYLKVEASAYRKFNDRMGEGDGMERAFSR